MMIMMMMQTKMLMMMIMMMMMLMWMPIVVIPRGECASRLSIRIVAKNDVLQLFLL